MVKYFFFCILIISTIYADDVYLKNGFVYRNVQVADTKNGQLKVRKDSIDMLFDTLDVLKIERRDFVPVQKSSYELFSKELQDNYFKKQIEIEQKKMTTKTDSIRNIINESYSWNRSIYFAFGWGTPQGLRLELGYSSQFSLAASFGIQDNWSRDPDEVTLALIGSIKFPIQSFQLTPYILAGYGGTITIFGGPDTYTLLNMGVLYELSRGIHLRPEIGITFTSKHITGGTSLLGGETTEIKEERARVSANLILEIDFANL